MSKVAKTPPILARPVLTTREGMLGFLYILCSKQNCAVRYTALQPQTVMVLRPAARARSATASLAWQPM